MAANLRAGVFPVRWMPDAAYGLGYPFFNHYSALPFYLAAGFNVLGLDILSAIKLTQTLGFIFAALAMYGWVYHLWKNRAAAWLAAVAYTVAPFHLVNVYVRGDSLSEFYAFIWYPLILWALQENRFWRKIGFLALSYAGLILSHNISAFIFTPFVMLYLLFQVRLKVRRTLSVVAGLLIGMALSAWAWLPALLEQDVVQPETLTLGYFNYANHFRAANLVQPGVFFDYSIAVTPADPGPFAMGGPQAVLAAAGLTALVWLAFENRRRTKGEGRKTSHETPFVFRLSSFVFLAAGLLLSTFMMTPLSRPLWEHAPLLEVVQFPWRFLSVQALFTAAVTAALAARLNGRRAWVVAGGIGALLAASTLWPLRPERLLIGPKDVTVTRLQEYELFTGNIGSTIRWEWLPRESKPRPFTSDAVIDPHAPPRPFLLSGALVEAVQTQRRPTGQTWRVETGPAGATLAFPLLYWPGWQAHVDGAKTSVWAVESAGYLALAAPPGEHVIHLSLGRTPLRAAAETLSLLTLSALLAVAMFRILQSAIRNHISRSISYSLLLTPYSLLLLFLVIRSSPPPPRSDDLTMDFVDQPYLHHNPSGADLGDARLLRYDLSADSLAPGETLTVTLHWGQSQIPNLKSQITLRLVSPAEHLPDLRSGPLPLAEDSAPLAETTVHRLTLPENTPRGLYVLQVQLDDADHAPFYLRPVRVVKGAPLPPDAPVLAQVGPDIRLHTARLGTSASHLEISLEWSTARPIAANYQVSVRLLDPAGELRASLDTQPGYGFSPTSLWRPGERIGDRYNLPLPDDLSPGDGYRLMLIFYRMPSTAEVARVTLPPFALPLSEALIFEPPPRLFELPPLTHRLGVDFGGQIQLAGYALDREAGSLSLTLWWVAQQQPQADYTVFVHLFDPATNAIAVQDDAMPRRGNYPTSAWLPGEVVSDTIQLDLRAAPAGNYRLAVGLYDAATATRLPATTPDGSPVSDNRLALPDVIEAPDK
jgi:hypothetical protein